MARPVFEQQRQDARVLSDAERAAILMLALGQDHGSKLWAMIEPNETKELSELMAKLMANLGTASAQLVERLLGGLVSQVPADRAPAWPQENTRQVHELVPPAAKPVSAPEENRSPVERTMWDRLSDVHELVLANYLKNEFPQTTAVILSKVQSDHAARVLDELPDQFALEVVRRMLDMEPVQPDILDKIEEALQAEFMSNPMCDPKRDPHEKVAYIFNKLKRKTEIRFLAALGRTAPQSAERIKAMMFTFGDLATLDPGSIQTLLRHIDRDVLALALKGSTDTLRDVVLSNMSERTGKVLQEEMESFGLVRLRDVEEAQLVVVGAVKNLAAKGEIMIAGKESEDAII